jgi:hypothetical protein
MSAFFCVALSYVGRGLAMGRSPVQGVVLKHVSFSLANGKGKGKVVAVLFLTEYNAIKLYWGSGGIAPLIL